MYKKLDYYKVKMWKNTVESSAFSSEFIAMKTCSEAIIGLRFKLRISGVPIDTPANVLCDNESVVNNSTKLESKLHKKTFMSSLSCY